MGCKIKFENCYTPDFEKVWSKCKKRRLSSRKEMGFEVFAQMRTRIEQLEQENKTLGDELETYVKMSKSAHQKIAELEKEKKVLVEALKEIEKNVPEYAFHGWAHKEAKKALAKIGGEK